MDKHFPGARGGRNRKQKLTGTQSLIRYENVLKLDIGDGTCTNCISIKLLFFFLNDQMYCCVGTALQRV